jgi:hypothetical protein
MKSTCVIEVAAEAYFGWPNKASVVVVKPNGSSKERNQDN